MEFRYPWRFESRRSAVMATGGVVATSSPVAARVGARVLEDGGSAADAAVATAAVLNVVEPHMTGVGGDAFALTHFDGEYDALNGSGGAPADADRAAYRDRTDESRPSPVDGTERPRIPLDGGMPVTVPGALDAWRRLLDRYGRRSLADALASAVEYAREGVPIPEYAARQWARSADRLRRFDESAETFLPGGSAPDPGDRFRNPALADTFETIAEEGVEAFYGGDVGEAVVETVRAHGGDLALSDLEAHEGEWTDPISTEYGGVEVLEHPPNGQGTVALEALNVAAEFDLPADPTDPDRLHHLVEATKVAFADGYAHIADLARADLPLDTMLSEAYAANRAAEIGLDAQVYEPRAGAWTPGDDTVYLTVVDGDGNAVSFINSIYASFGSGLTARGFALQNRGTAFSLDPDHPNAVAPGKRPYHTIIPAMLREDGEFRASWGVMGGSMQPQGHLQVGAAMVAGDLNPQAALDAPRFRWLERKRIALETSRLPDETVADLRDRGHEIVPEDEYFAEGGHWGGGQVVVRRDDGTLIAGSDPRRDGQAVGF
jgi:gamma-glutamyltranspeptidase/glutathione hydrolase